MHQIAVNTVVRIRKAVEEESTESFSPDKFPTEEVETICTSFRNLVRAIPNAKQDYSLFGKDGEEESDKFSLFDYLRKEPLFLGSADRLFKLICNMAISIRNHDECRLFHDDPDVDDYVQRVLCK